MNSIKRLIAGMARRRLAKMGWCAVHDCEMDWQESIAQLAGSPTYRCMLCIQDEREQQERASREYAEVVRKARDAYRDIYKRNMGVSQ